MISFDHPFVRDVIARAIASLTAENHGLADELRGARDQLAEHGILPESPDSRTRIYLASRYSRREELCRHRDVLERQGFRITSTWLDRSVSQQERLLQDHAGCAAIAADDVHDVVRADVVVSFTEEPRSRASRGGRHVELGLALGLGRPCLIVGPRENVFHFTPGVHRSPDFGAAYEWLMHWRRRHADA